MTNLVRWDPFTELRTTMDKLFEEGFSRPWRLLAPEYENSFPLEVSETDQDIEVKAALPGLRPEDVDITVANDVLTIKGEHREEKEDKKRDFYRREIRYGSFHRSITLPMTVDADKAEATYENGILRLRLPKAEAVRPKQIKVNTPKTIEAAKA